MRKLFGTLALLLADLLVVFVLVGCGGDEDVENEKMPVSFVSADPPSGSCDIAANASITLTFDGEPEDVTVSPGTAVSSGKNVTVSGPFTPGPLSLAVSWADGSTTLTYALCGFAQYPPMVTGGTVEDGDKDVNPETINSAGKIEITFNTDVTGNIALQTQGGADVGWLGKVEDNKATLELVKGREIVSETTYVIVGKVSNPTGDEAAFKITFVTRGKE